MHLQGVSTIQPDLLTEKKEGVRRIIVVSSSTWLQIRHSRTAQGLDGDCGLDGDDKGVFKYATSIKSCSIYVGSDENQS
jgi:hypothetical protein